MAIPTGSLKARVLGVLAIAAVWTFALVGPVAAAPPDSGAGGTGANVSLPATGSEGLFSSPANFYYPAIVLACAVVALVVYRRFRRGAVASG
jgi:hypothetical protein